MKVKRFARGKGGRGGSSHKRFAWKQKMKSRAESYGSTGTPGTGNCFKCGQPGHWANKCRGKTTGLLCSFHGKSCYSSCLDPLVYLISLSGINKNVEETSVDDHDFPTIRDAALIAKGMKYEKIKRDRKDQNAGEPQSMHYV